MDGGRHRRALLISAMLIAVTLLVYAPVRWHTFVDYDDYEGVVENPHVNRGLTRDGIAWAFTQSHAANWYPMTYLSHMLDCQLFGLDAGAAPRRLSIQTARRCRPRAGTRPTRCGSATVVARAVGMWISRGVSRSLTAEEDEDGQPADADGLHHPRRGRPSWRHTSASL